MRTIIFAISAFCFVILILVVFLSLSVFRPPEGSAPIVTAPTTIPLPTRMPPSPIVEYNSQKTNQLVDAAKKRQELSPTGASTKQRLIRSLNGSSGNIYNSPTVTIEYIKAPDLFQAGIKSGNVSEAKQEAINWMTSQGFSANDLCILPFSFYLSTQVKASLQGESIQFNPLPDSC